MFRLIWIKRQSVYVCSSETFYGLLNLYFVRTLSHVSIWVNVRYCLLSPPLWLVTVSQIIHHNFFDRIKSLFPLTSWRIFPSEVDLITRLTLHILKFLLFSFTSYRNCIFIPSRRVFYCLVSKFYKQVNTCYTRFYLLSKPL